ncbi:MAG TPA: type IX secretion system membrane protein PorP/SprF [Bacteroidia bacterium]|nr:type IX secretion system membrane protein PorP/SprF [Bacteroidia bacterium]
MNIYLSDLRADCMLKNIWQNTSRDMRKTLTTVAFVLGSIAAFSQQDPQFSQYMYNKLFMNPGYAGIRQALCATAIYRDQWQGFDGAPKTGVFSADYFSPAIHGGVGLNIMTDKLGFESTMAFRADYSFHVLNLAGGVLGIGVELGAVSKRIGPTGSDSWIATTNWQSDQSIPPQLKKTVFDAGAGLWYQRQNIWFGISSTHLSAAQVDDGTASITPTSPPGPPVVHNLKYQIAHHYFVTGGINLFQGNTWEIRPSFLVKSDATITSIDISCLAMFNQRFWFGANYRVKDAICPMVGFQIPNKLMTPDGRPDGGLKVGFAYDYTTSDLNNYNNGTFEVFLNYCVPIVVTPKRQGHGDVRIFD